MLNQTNGQTIKSTVISQPETSPLERAKQIVSGMARSEKDAYWLGVRMENFLRLGGRGAPRFEEAPDQWA